MSKPAGIASPSPYDISANNIPKSGASTPNCFCTATEVKPILRPTKRRPSTNARCVFASCTAYAISTSALSPPNCGRTGAIAFFDNSASRIAKATVSTLVSTTAEFDIMFP